MDTLHGLEVFKHSLLFLILILSAYTDLSYGKLYNWYTIPGILLGVICNMLQGHLVYHSWWNPLVMSSGIGFSLAFFLFFFLYLSGGFGAGDMKLAGAIGAIMGWKFILNALVYISLVGAMMAVAVLIWHGKLRWGIQKAIRLIVGGKRKDMDGSSRDLSGKEEEKNLKELDSKGTSDQNSKEGKNLEKVGYKDDPKKEKPLTIPYGFVISLGTMWAYFLEFLKNF